jgi:hypothetical protein
VLAGGVRWVDARNLVLGPAIGARTRQTCNHGVLNKTSLVVVLRLCGRPLRSRDGRIRPSLRKRFGEDVLGIAALGYVGLRSFCSGFQTSEYCHCILQFIVAVGRLAGMGVAGGFLGIGHRRDVDEVSGRGELHGVFAVGDFVVVESESVLELLPCLEGEIRDGTVVGVVIDGPMGEDGVGVFSIEDFLEGLVVIVVDNSVSIGLVGVDGTGFEDLTRLLCFGNADGCGGLPGAVIEVEEGDVVSLGGEAGDSPSAAVFGVAGVTARDNDSVLFGRTWGLCGGIEGGGCGGKAHRFQDFSTIHRWRLRGS